MKYLITLLLLTSCNTPYANTYTDSPSCVVYEWGGEIYCDYHEEMTDADSINTN